MLKNVGLSYYTCTYLYMECLANQHFYSTLLGRGRGYVKEYPCILSNNGDTVDCTIRVFVCKIAIIL